MEYLIDVSRLNEEGFDYLKEVFPDFEGDDPDYLYSYLTYCDGDEIILKNYGDISDFSSGIIRIINDVNEDYNNLTLSYATEEIKPKDNIILDIVLLNKKGHDYLKKLFNFPDHYGKNLDALYDCLSDLDDTQIIIINMDEVNRRSLKILSVFDDVAEEFGNLKLSYEYDEEERP